MVVLEHHIIRKVIEKDTNNLNDKLMKRFILALAAAFTLVAAAQAQTATTNTKREQANAAFVQKRTQSMAKKYGLNAEQTQKLLEANTAYFAKTGARMRPMRLKRGAGKLAVKADSLTNRKALKALTPLQKQQMRLGREQMRAAKTEYEAQLKTIMTADQFKAYEDAKQQRSAKASSKTVKAQQK